MVEEGSALTMGDVWCLRFRCGGAVGNHKKEASGEDMGMKICC